MGFKNLESLFVFKCNPGSLSRYCMIEHAASKAWRVGLVHLKSRNYSGCPSVVGKCNTERCEGFVKDLLGFLTKQKLLFLFGRMHSSMFPCQVECWSGSMHSLGMTGHVLPLGREFARLCLWHVFSARVTKTTENWFLFLCPLPLSLDSAASTSQQEDTVWQPTTNLHQSHSFCGHYP